MAASARSPPWPIRARNCQALSFGHDFAETRSAFPDQRNELISLRHADDAVIVEFDLLGTHLGPLRSLPPTGRAFRTRVCAFFIFEGDRIVCERVYFDQLSILRQLGIAQGPSD